MNSQICAWDAFANQMNVNFRQRVKAGYLSFSVVGYVAGS